MTATSKQAISVDDLLKFLFRHYETDTAFDMLRFVLMLELDDEPWSRRANYGGWEDFPQTPEAQERLRALGFKDLADHYAKTPEQLTGGAALGDGGRPAGVTQAAQRL
jgi:hypothetical protein